MLDKILSVSRTRPPTPAFAGLWRVKSTAGVNVDEDTAMSYAAVFASVKVISETAAMLPWRPYLQAGSRRELQAGSALDVLLHRKPNGEQTAFQWREFLVASALLHGNGYSEIESKANGEPLALHPIHPSRVEPSRTEVGALFYRVHNDNGTWVDIPARQMFHLRGPTKDGVVGWSVISLARESWGLGIAAEQFASGFFGNGAIPSLVIKQDEQAAELSKEGVANLLESFELRHRGSKGAGKPAFLETGYDIKPLGIPQKDAQFLETRRFSVSDVSRWFRVPPHKIGDLDKATFSNIESQERAFANDAIMPWVVRLEQEANAKLIQDPRFVTKVEMRGLLRGDSASRADFYQKMRDLGALDINEIRELEDMNPLAGAVGALRLVPSNMVSVERAAAGGGTDPAAAMRGVVLEAHERMLTKEAHAVERARAGGKDMSGWGSEFYARHAEQMRDALTPGALALGATVGLAADLVAGVVTSHVALHCEASLVLCVGQQEVAGNRRASAQTDRLIGLLIGAANGK